MIRSTVASFLLLLCITSFAAESQSEISGRVTDSEGAALAKARVLLHWDPSGSAVGLTDNIGIKDDVTVTTDANGNYSLNVPAGFYDVFVSAMAFTPTAAKVRLKQGKRTQFSAKLRADPLVTKELD